MNKYVCYYTPKGEETKVTMLDVSFNEDRVYISTDNVGKLFEMLESEDFEEREKVMNIINEIVSFVENMNVKYKNEPYSDILVNEMCNYVYEFMTSLCEKFEGMTCENTFE